MFFCDFLKALDHSVIHEAGPMADFNKCQVIVKGRDKLITGFLQAEKSLLICLLLFQYLQLFFKILIFKELGYQVKTGFDKVNSVEF